MDKYNLSNILKAVLEDGSFPRSICWKSKVKNVVFETEKENWLKRMSSDNDFCRFLMIHSSLEPHPFWKLAIKRPGNRDSIYHIMKLIVTLRCSAVRNLCHRCGYFYDDVTTHIILNCSFTEMMRDEFWCRIINISDINFSVFIHSLNDDELIHGLFSGNPAYDLSKDDLEEFRIQAVKFLHGCIKHYYI